MSAAAQQLSMDLPPAPPHPVVDGSPAFGAYQGACERVTWDGLAGAHARGAAWRFLHAKRWHYVSLAGPRAVCAMAIVDAGYATTAFAYLFDREARLLRADLSWLGLPQLSARVADRAGDGARSTFAAGGAVLRLERRGATWELHARAPGGFMVEATLDAGTAPPGLCAIAAIDGGVANCTHKISCLPARGVVGMGATRLELDGHFGAIDHTSGLLARDTRWRWANAAGDGLGLNLVSGFNGPIENVLWARGGVHKVGAARIDYESADGPWRVTTEDRAVELTFHPEGERRKDEDLVLAVSRYVQPFGTFRGWCVRRAAARSRCASSSG